MNGDAHKVRLLYITTQVLPSPKASTVQVMQMCAGFAANGIAVQLVTPEPVGGRVSALEICEYYGVLSSFEIDQMPWPRIPRPADVLQVQAVWRERRSKWLCYTRGRDVTAPLIALGMGAKAIAEMHTPPMSMRERLMLRLIQAHPRGRLVTLSKVLRDRCVGSWGFRTDRIVIAPDGVDLQRFEPQISAADARNQLGLGQGPWITYVGGLHQGRGLESLFRAVAKMPVQLLIVGGRDQAEIEFWKQRAMRTGATNISFVGYQAPARVPLYLFASDVLAMPYEKRVLTGRGEDITEWTSPLKMFEYMAANRPIVSTDLPVLRNVLVHEQNALLIPPDDVRALNAAFQRLLSDSALSKRLAARARADAAEYTWETRARDILTNSGVTQ